MLRWLANLDYLDIIFFREQFNFIILPAIGNERNVGFKLKIENQNSQILIQFGPIAQLDRASDYGSGG